MKTDGETKGNPPVKCKNKNKTIMALIRDKEGGREKRGEKHSHGISSEDESTCNCTVDWISWYNAIQTLTGQMFCATPGCSRRVILSP